MKIIITLWLLAATPLFSQMMEVRDVPVVIQEQNQWCWAGVSACILGCYGLPADQCKIVEFTRKLATWHNFGKKNCCDYPAGECNYVNCLFGDKGCVSDILSNFAKIESKGLYRSMNLNEVHQELSEGRPFIFGWEWYVGGGHLLVGYGAQDSIIYYMNPWFGEGKKIADYHWIVNDGEHNWVMSLELNSTPEEIKHSSATKDSIFVYPNPAHNELRVLGVSDGDKGDIVDYQGSTLIKNIDLNDEISVDLPVGTYFFKVNHLGSVIVIPFIIMN